MNTMTEKAVGLLGVLFVFASLFAVSPAAQAADTPSAQAAATKKKNDSRPGYRKVMTPESYLKDPLQAGVRVLHLDTEHMTQEGFWSAQVSPFDERGFAWVYQPFGMWCDDTSLVPAFNPWTNSHGCHADWEAEEAKNSLLYRSTQACRAETGYPWKYGSSIPGTVGCGDEALSFGAGSMRFEPGHAYDCAPWEDQRLRPNGSARCADTTYPWMTEADLWLPAPDACTGMPADSAYLNPRRLPSQYAPKSGGDGTCTGADLAPNCPAESVHPGCTGVEVEAKPAASATVTVSVTDGTATRSKYAQGQAKVVRATVARTVKRVVKGRTYTATGRAQVIKTRKANATAAVTVPDGAATRTATMTCFAETLPTAQACAEGKADTEATRLARTAAHEDAAARAAKQAQTAAKQTALTRATDRAQRAPVTSSDRARAAKAARAKALTKLNLLIAAAAGGPKR